MVIPIEFIQSVCIHVETQKLSEMVLLHFRYKAFERNKNFVTSFCRKPLSIEQNGRLKTRNKQVEETEKIGLKSENALNRAMWQNGVRRLAEEMGVDSAIFVKGKKPIKTE